MAVDITDFFDRQMPEAMVKHPADFQALGSKFHVNISGQSYGYWYINASASGPSCTGASYVYDDTSADTTLTITDEDFQKLMDNPKSNFMTLFFAGRIKISGNQALVMHFPDLLMLVSA